MKSDERRVKKDFFPSSEWLYLKIYCGFKSGEKVLANEVFNFVINHDDLFEKFFFIRYSDDAPHFRIRFYNKSIEKQSIVQNKFMECLESQIENEVIHKVVIDTYKRELNRYGDSMIEDAESLFYHDSVSALCLINLLSQIEDPEKYRLLMSLRSIDELLNNFKLSLDEKQEFSKRIQTSFFREFGAHPNLQKQLNDKYRKYQKLIFTHLDRAKDLENEIEEAVAFFDYRSEQSRDAVNTIKSKIESSEELFEKLASYVHMLMNRIFISQQRKYELMIYHFLEKYYTSQKAIKSKSTKNV